MLLGPFCDNITKYTWVIPKQQDDLNLKIRCKSTPHLQEGRISLPMNLNVGTLHTVKYLHCLSQLSSLTQSVKNSIGPLCVLDFNNLSTPASSAQRSCVCRRCAEFSTNSHTRSPWQGQYQKAPAFSQTIRI